MSLERSRVTSLTSWTLWSLRVGVESVGVVWLVVVLLTVAVSMASSSLSAAAALSAGEALRAGTALWSLGFGGMVTSSSEDQGTLSLPLLGLTLAQAGWTWICVRRARPTRPAAGVAIVLAATAVAVLACLTGPAGLEIWPAVGGITVITGVVVAVQLQRAGKGWAGLNRWWDRRPHWVEPALSLAYGAARALALLSLLVVVAAVLVGAGRVSVLHDSLARGGFVSIAGLVLLQVGWVPTLLIWACSWLIGAGFSVGTGTVFAPDRVVAGGVGLLCVAASGSVGPGRMTDVGPQVLYTVILVFVEVGVGLAAMAVLAHPYTRAWARGTLPESVLPAAYRRRDTAADEDVDEQDGRA